MKEYNESNWKEALHLVFQRSATDQTYRELCLQDPRAAIMEVSDIDLPMNFSAKFSDGATDDPRAYVLPAFGAMPADDPVPTPQNPPGPVHPPSGDDPDHPIPRTF